jgi:hypothetical protein
MLIRSSLDLPTLAIDRGALALRHVSLRTGLRQPLPPATAAHHSDSAQLLGLLAKISHALTDAGAPLQNVKQGGPALNAATESLPLKNEAVRCQDRTARELPCDLTQ